MVTQQKKDDSPRVAQAKAAILAAKSGQGKKSKRRMYSEVTRTDEEAEDTGKAKHQEFSTREKVKVGKNLLGQTVVKVKSYQSPNDVEPYNSGSHKWWESEPSAQYRAAHSKHDKKEKYKITFKGDPEEGNYTEKTKQKKEKYDEHLTRFRTKAGYGSKEKTFTTTKDGEKEGFRTEKHKSKGFNHLFGTTSQKTPKRYL